MGRHVVLLRGVNVGGNNKLPMAPLREALESVGFADVQTYIQSGNVVLTAPSVDPDDIKQILVNQFDLDVPIVIRSDRQLAQAIKANPFPEVEATPKQLLTYFCDIKPTKASLKDFDATQFEPDRFAVTGANAYVAYDTSVSRSKLTNVVIDRNLKVVSTARNWSTVLKLYEMVSSPNGSQQ